MPPHTMSAWQDAPDLGAYTAQADSDEEVLAELEREVEALNDCLLYTSDAADDMPYV